MKIALDAMGSDCAPFPEIQGAIQAIRQSPKPITVALVGDESEIHDALPEAYRSIEIIHATQRVLMSEKPSEVVRSKRDSSISVGLGLLKERSAQAFISAGNTGAIMAFSLSILGRLPGIKRPAIASPLPTMKSVALLIDAGANVDAKPEHLVQSAIMGSEYYRHVYSRAKPRVGLLSVGEERTKGQDTVFSARSMLEEVKDLNFMGFVEGNAVFEGTADIVVTDGFTGNIVLKFAEGVGTGIYKVFREIVASKPVAALGGMLLKPYLRAFAKKFDYEEYGGAPLLGVDGPVLIAHGRSTPKAIRSAILNAAKFAEGKVNEKIVEHLEAKVTISEEGKA
jgi:glycerol-3-phosphate acyltransferase PlsX